MHLETTTGLRVSDHAIVRYLERVKGLNISEVIEEMIPEKTLFAVDVLAHSPVQREFCCETHRILVKEFTIVTVYDERIGDDEWELRKHFFRLLVEDPRLRDTTWTRCVRQLRARNKQLKERSRLLKKKEKALQAKEQELQEREDRLKAPYIRNWETELASRSVKLNQRLSAVAEQEKKAEKREGDLLRREETINRRESTIQKLENQIGLGGKQNLGGQIAARWFKALNTAKDLPAYKDRVEELQRLIAHHSIQTDVAEDCLHKLRAALVQSDGKVTQDLLQAVIEKLAAVEKGLTPEFLQKLSTTLITESLNHDRAVELKQIGRRVNIHSNLRLVEEVRSLLSTEQFLQLSRQAEEAANRQKATKLFRIDISLTQQIADLQRELEDLGVVQSEVRSRLPKEDGLYWPSTLT